MHYTDRVKKVFTQFTSAKADDIHAETRVDEIGDSLTHVEIVMGLEEEFGISISDDEADKLQTFQDFDRLVTQKKGG